MQKNQKVELQEQFFYITLLNICFGINISASQFEISDSGKNSDQMLYLV